MIDEARTLELFGYTSDELSKGSHKKVVAVCEECGMYRDVEKKQYRMLCKGCAHIDRTLTKDHKQKIRERMTGSNNPNYGKKDSQETHKRRVRALMGNHRSAGCTQKLSPEVRKRRSESMIGNTYGLGNSPSQETRDKMSQSALGHTVSEETKKRISDNNARHWFGKSPSEETRKKISAAGQGISYDEWEGFAKEQLYCPKFNEACKESNRNKYGRHCFLTGVPEAENMTKTGDIWKLSVHHVDMDKMQGCVGNRWKLVPLLMGTHTKMHSEVWEARIEYLLEHVWYPDGVWSPDALC